MAGKFLTLAKKSCRQAKAAAIWVKFNWNPLAPLMHIHDCSAQAGLREMPKWSVGTLKSLIEQQLHKLLDFPAFAARQVQLQLPETKLQPDKLNFPRSAISCFYANARHSNNWAGCSRVASTARCTFNQLKLREIMYAMCCNRSLCIDISIKQFGRRSLILKIPHRSNEILKYWRTGFTYAYIRLSSMRPILKSKSSELRYSLGSSQTIQIDHSLSRMSMDSLPWTLCNAVSRSSTKGRMINMLREYV